MRKSYWLAALAGVLLGVSAMAQSGISFQGRLEMNGQPATGEFDMQVYVFSQATGGGDNVWITYDNVAVNKGLFTLVLEGIESFFNTGLDRWLEIRVRPGASTGAFTTLSPRIQALRVPYAQFAHRPWRIQPNNALAYLDGNVGIGDSTPAATFTVGALDKFQVAGSNGSVRFNDTQASITFAGTATTAMPPMIHMFDWGGPNVRRMVLAHSPGFPNWGLEYDDFHDMFHFRTTNQHRFSVDLMNGRLGIDQPAPALPISFANQLGGKVSFWQSGTSHYGIGVQNSLLQVHTAGATDDIAFGWGSSTAFNETMRVKGNGNIIIGPVDPVLGRFNVHNPTGIAIYGRSNAGNENGGTIWGTNNGVNGNGVVGAVDGMGSPYGVWGRIYGSQPNAFAGYFTGNVNIVGRMSATMTKSFRIDHPLDPLNKYLYHHAMESPEALNVYRGTAVLDANGRATVNLPDYFTAINREVSVQLTAMGAAMPNLHTLEDTISGPTFTIAGGAPGKRVAWMVTAERDDVYTRHLGVPVEQMKPEALRGTYIDATVYGLPQEESEAFRRGGAVAEPTK